MDAEPWLQAERPVPDVVENPWILGVMKRLKAWGTGRTREETEAHLHQAPVWTQLPENAVRGKIVQTVFNYAHATSRDAKLASSQTLAQLIDQESDQAWWEELVESLPGVSEQAASALLKKTLANKPSTLGPLFD